MFFLSFLPDSSSYSSISSFLTCHLLTFFPFSPSFNNPSSYSSFSTFLICVFLPLLSIILSILPSLPLSFFSSYLHHFFLSSLNLRSVLHSSFFPLPFFSISSFHCSFHSSFPSTSLPSYLHHFFLSSLNLPSAFVSSFLLALRGTAQYFIGPRKELQAKGWAGKKEKDPGTESLASARKTCVPGRVFKEMYKYCCVGLYWRGCGAVSAFLLPPSPHTPTTPFSSFLPLSLALSSYLSLPLYFEVACSRFEMV